MTPTQQAEADESAQKARAMSALLRQYHALLDYRESTALLWAAKILAGVALAVVGACFLLL